MNPRPPILHPRLYMLRSVVGLTLYDPTGRINRAILEVLTAPRQARRKQRSRLK